MSRLLGVFAALVALTVVAHADAPTCEVESQAVKADEQTNGRDPAMRSPTDRRAKRHMSDGTDWHREGLKRSRVVGQDDAAAEAFRAAVKAYEAGALIDPAGLLLYNLAQSYRALGDYERAIDQYRRILDNVRPREPVRRLVECHIAGMTAELERAARTSPPRDAIPTEPEPTEDTTRPTPEANANPATPALGITRSMPEERTAPWHKDGLGWGAVGTGVVSAGVGAFFLFDASRLHEEADREDRDDLRLDLRAQADSHRTWGTIAIAAGGALVVAGVVKLAIHPKQRASVTDVSLGLGPRAFVLQGSF